MHAGVAVLANRVLWDLITGFMTGYPIAVGKFHHGHRATVLRKDTRVGSPTDDGVLLHLAIAHDDMKMLKRMYELAQVRAYQNDQKLGRAMFMHCAVLYDNVKALECIKELATASELVSWSSMPSLLRIALRRANPDVRVLDWICTHFHQDGSYPTAPPDMYFHAQRGNFAVVQWLHEHKTPITRDAVNEAARGRHLRMLQYFYTHSPRRCGRKAVEVVAARGHLDILEFIFAHQMHEDMRTVAINAATRHGQLEILMTLVERYKSELELPTVIDHAAAGGHLGIVWYLYEVHFKDGGGCTSRAMRDAAVNGHLEVVKFLFENRTEGCAPDALSLAAQECHMGIVQFLREKLALTGLTAAMEIIARVKTLAFLYERDAGRCLEWVRADVAGRGRLRFIQYLRESATVVEKNIALKCAASTGDLDVVRFFARRCTYDSCTTALQQAAKNGHLEVVKFLYMLCQNDGVVAGLCSAAYSGQLPVLAFLSRRLPEAHTLSALCAAVASGQLKAVKILYCELKAGESAYLAMAIAVRNSFHRSQVVQYFVENQEREPMKSFLKQAVVKGAVIVANAILNRSGSAIAMNELVEALELAVELSRQEIGDLITVKIAARED